MPDAINVILYSPVPTDGGDFEHRFLTKLGISAYDVDEPYPIPAAAAQPAGKLIRTATYDPPLLCTSTSAIPQHFVDS